MRDTSQESLTELVSRVVDDAKGVARAEIAVVKAQAGAKVAGYRTAAILLVAAYYLGTAALVGLVVGLIMTLTPRVGPGWATLIVIGAVVLLAGLLAKLGLDRIKAAGR